MSAIDPKDLLNNLLAANETKIREDALLRIGVLATKYHETNVEMLTDIANMIIDAYHAGSNDAANNFLDLVKMVYGTPVA